VSRTAEYLLEVLATGDWRGARGEPVEGYGGGVVQTPYTRTLARARVCVCIYSRRRAGHVRSALVYPFLPKTYSWRARNINIYEQLRRFGFVRPSRGGSSSNRFAYTVGLYGEPTVFGTGSPSSWTAGNIRRDFFDGAIDGGGPRYGTAETRHWRKWKRSTPGRRWSTDDAFCFRVPFVPIRKSIFRRLFEISKRVISSSASSPAALTHNRIPNYPDTSATSFGITEIET